MTWNYRIIHRDTLRQPYFAVHEVFYDEHGKIDGWTVIPIDLTGENKAEIVSTLKQMLADGKADVLIESELEKDLAKTKSLTDR